MKILRKILCITIDATFYACLIILARVITISILSHFLSLPFMLKHETKVQ